jgi:hypothetical protein
MRLYDAVLAEKGGRCRFGADHPLWPRTQKGKPYSRQPPQSVLKSIKGIDLYPSVTTFCSLADLGGFDAGCRYITSLIAKAPKGNITKWIEEERVKQRDLGTLCHEGAEYFVKTGEMPDDEEINRHLLRIVDKLNEARDMGAEVEIQFCSAELGFGGTADVVVPSTIVRDYKFIGNPRKAKPSELAQVAAYMKAFNCPKGELLLTSTKTGKVLPVRVDVGTKIHAVATHLYEGALDMWNTLQLMKEIA